MQIISKLSPIKTNYFSILFCLMPMSFIAGNLIININVLLIVLSTIIVFKNSLLQIKFFLLDKLIFSLFLLIVLSGIYNDIQIFLKDKEFSDFRGHFESMKKSIYFLKYLFLYITLRFLIERKVVDLKFFFISSSLSSLFVSFDIFYQYYFGKDIFGFEVMESFGRKLTGPFGNEAIAGGYIQRFSIFTFFVLPLFFTQQSKYFSKYLTPILFIIFFIGIILSGNRMPLLLFVFSIFLILIFNKNVRKYFFPFIIIFSLLFSIIYNFNSKVNANFQSFYYNVSKIIKIATNQNLKDHTTPQYFKEFATFYDTWLLNKHIGGGIKNFRYYCHVRPNIDKNSKFICNMHPHNYYLEILTEIGWIGFVILLSIFSIIIYYSLIKKYFLPSLIKKNNIIIPFIFLFLVEIFPLKSSGSFFTTGNTTYLFLIMAVIIGIFRKENSIENNH